MTDSPTVTTEIDADGVAVVELDKPPHNYIDGADVAALSDALHALDGTDARAIVLCSSGRHFCAGAELGSKRDDGNSEPAFAMYEHVPGLFSTALPIVAAVHGAAIGAGLGLALVADFRVAADNARFVAPFTRLGFHPGFGITVTLPAVIGHQRAMEVLYTGREVGAAEASAIGLCDRVVPADELRSHAVALAAEIAAAAPLGVRATRRTLRGDLARRVQAALEVERAEQTFLMTTDDFREGVEAAAARRPPTFSGR